MSIKKNITIDGMEVPFKASAAVPRLYRLKFRRDIYKDFASLKTDVEEGDENKSELDIESLEVFENIAYIMAKHADPSIPDSPEEWLDEFSTFSIYQVLPKIIERIEILIDISMELNTINTRNGGRCLEWHLLSVNLNHLCHTHTILFFSVSSVAALFLCLLRGKMWIRLSIMTACVLRISHHLLPNGIPPKQTNITMTGIKHMTK